ncbi:aminopeptidase P family protein [Nesterenkonia alkaliphila]|uniref:Xaa-Pro aminopeptidase n=1 Tax=Nesterenkonia alkaliphila TaxID=1463631 RepID=A0A7K1UHE7_9MICC|nr:aminopeptidase P family protein [Nesterenkonia alkaliphila]MVT25859.1 M24 family metallopeptidase [Nesterenkonia alkaliphila]GFZ76590.1 Xaa-Pro aminopeptidase [Nesterenkonia alkaliphila]
MTSDAQTSDESQQLQDRVNNRSQRPQSEAFKAFMAAQWAPTEGGEHPRDEVADFTPRRRAAVSERFAGERIVIPAGPLKVRSNDTDYRFRPHSAFAHLTGLGVDHEPNAVLVFEPAEHQAPSAWDTAHHEVTLYFKPMAGRDTEEFYADSRHGEFWIGPRPDLAEFEQRLGIRTRDLDQFEAALSKDVGPAASGGTQVRLLREADLNVDALVDTARAEASMDLEASDALDAELTEFCSELRLVKDDWEVEQLRGSVAATIAGFEDVVRALPRAVGHDRGERIVEGAFFARARLEGNDLGYDTIAASGNNATILHWIRNHDRIDPGELLLLDAGVEADSLYTADITRTIPVSGSYSPVQRRVYEAVLAAADAAFEVVRPGIKFRDIHATAVKVLAEHLDDWGLLPVSLDEALSPEGQQHRRWMPHGTSHHLGLDVHDCAQAKRDLYLDGVLEPGMVFTIEPGLYFKNEDLAVPEEYRGIGVRIEDDVLVTEDGCENLSAALPRKADDVESWIARLQA